MRTNDLSVHLLPIKALENEPSVSVNKKSDCEPFVSPVSVNKSDFELVVDRYGFFEGRCRYLGKQGGRH